MKKTKPKASAPSEEFNRFQDFTRRLMAVPKKEIDAEKAKYDKQKAARKKESSLKQSANGYRFSMKQAWNYRLSLVALLAVIGRFLS